jgi:hypothetical protein
METENFTEIQIITAYKRSRNYLQGIYQSSTEGGFETI